MPTAHRINRFPGGNIGGIVARTGPEARNASINLFMPPMKEQEVTLHIPGLPSRGTIDTGKMRPVLSYEGNGIMGLWYLRLSMRDSMNSNVWSAFSFANVWSPKANVCWGLGNSVPSTFADAWHTFFGAPFNRDLAVNDEPLPYNEWERRHPAVTKDTGQERIVRMNKRFREMCDEGVEYSMTDVAVVGLEDQDRYTAARRRRERYQAAMSVIRARRSDAGRPFVAPNDAAYMAAKRLYDRENEACLDYNRRVGDIRNALRDLESWAQHHARYYAMAVQDVTDNGQSIGLVGEYMRTVYKALMKPVNGEIRDRNGDICSRPNMLRLIGEVEALSRWKVTKARIRRWLRFKCYAETLANMSQRGNRQQEYDDYCNAFENEATKRHFLEGKWTDTLVFEEVAPRLKKWGHQFTFPPCDGLIHLPSFLFGAEPPKLPIYSTSFVFRAPNGEAWQLSDSHARCAFYRSATEKVKMLFDPSSEKTYATNGCRVLEVTDQTLEAVLTDLEGEDTRAFDPVAAAIAAGKMLGRDRRFDDAADRRAIPYDAPDEPRDDEIEPELDIEFAPEGPTGVAFDRNCACYVCQEQCGCQDCLNRTERQVERDADGGVVRVIAEACECSACDALGNDGDLVWPHHGERPRAEQRPLQGQARFRIAGGYEDHGEGDDDVDHDLRRVGRTNHCGCAGLDHGYSHAWCEGCQTHVCD